MTRSGATGPTDDETFEDFLWELDVTRANPDRPDPRLRTAAPSTRPWTADAAPRQSPLPEPGDTRPVPPRRARRPHAASLVVLRILAAACLLSGTALLVVIALTR